MLRIIKARAYAKINIGLRVLAPRRDGFHNIESIFHSLSLCDILEAEALGGEGDCIVECEGMELCADNTLVRAYEGFCNESGLHPAVRIRLTKQIPAGSGLGGGSSDAAALLGVLNRMFCAGLSYRRLRRIARGIGSDVFFFLSCPEGGAALVHGRGEHVRNITARRDLYFVLVFPPVHSSTARAYALVDDLMDHEEDDAYLPRADLESAYSGPLRDWTFRNTFEAPLAQYYPPIAEARAALEAAGASFVRMSGAGSTVFGVFESLGAACRTAERLGGRQTLVCGPPGAVI